MVMYQNVDVLCHINVADGANISEVCAAMNVE
jgi:hypothetical protein